MNAHATQYSTLQGWYALSGRRNRISYFLSGLCAVMVTGVAGEVLLGTVASAGGALDLAIMVLLGVTFSCLSAQRARDAGWSPAVVLVAFWIAAVLSAFLHYATDESLAAVGFVGSVVAFGIVLALLLVPGRPATEVAEPFVPQQASQPFAIHGRGPDDLRPLLQSDLTNIDKPADIAQPLPVAGGVKPAVVPGSARSRHDRRGPNYGLRATLAVAVAVAVALATNFDWAKPKTAAEAAALARESAALARESAEQARMVVEQTRMAAERARQ